MIRRCLVSCMTKSYSISQVCYEVPRARSRKSPSYSRWMTRTWNEKTRCVWEVHIRDSKDLLPRSSFGTLTTRYLWPKEVLFDRTFFALLFCRFSYGFSASSSSSTIFRNAVFSFGLRDLLRELLVLLLSSPARLMKASILKVFLISVLVAVSCGSPSPRSRRVP